MDMWFNFFFCLSIWHFLKDKCKIAKLLLKHLKKINLPFFYSVSPDPASSKPHVLLHASLPLVVSSLRDLVQPPHWARLPFLHLFRQTDVYVQWSDADLVPGTVMAGREAKGIWWNLFLPLLCLVFKNLQTGLMFSSSWKMLRNSNFCIILFVIVLSPTGQ